MSVEVCTKCCRYVDLDFHSDEGDYIDGKWICVDCQQFDELKRLESSDKAEGVEHDRQV